MSFLGDSLLIEDVGVNANCRECARFDANDYERVNVDVVVNRCMVTRDTGRFNVDRCLVTFKVDHFNYGKGVLRRRVADKGDRVAAMVDPFILVIRCGSIHYFVPRVVNAHGNGTDRATLSCGFVVRRVGAVHCEGVTGNVFVSRRYFGVDRNDEGFIPFKGGVRVVVAEDRVCPPRRYRCRG